MPRGKDLRFGSILDCLGHLFSFKREECFSFEYNIFLSSYGMELNIYCFGKFVCRKSMGQLNFHFLLLENKVDAQ